MVERAGRVETSCHLQVVLWNRCWIFSFWWANMCHEIRLLDLWWVPGQEKFYISLRKDDILRHLKDGLLRLHFRLLYTLSALCFWFKWIGYVWTCISRFLFREIYKFLNNAFIVSHLIKNSLQLGAKIRYYYRESTVRKWCLEKLQ